MRSCPRRSPRPGPWRTAWRCWERPTRRSPPRASRASPSKGRWRSSRGGRSTISRRGCRPGEKPWGCLCASGEPEVMVLLRRACSQELSGGSHTLLLRMTAPVTSRGAEPRVLATCLPALRVALTEARPILLLPASPETQARRRRRRPSARLCWRPSPTEPSSSARCASAPLRLDSDCGHRLFHPSLDYLLRSHLSVRPAVPPPLAPAHNSSGSSQEESSAASGSRSPSRSGSSPPSAGGSRATSSCSMRRAASCAYVLLGSARWWCLLLTCFLFARFAGAAALGPGGDLAPRGRPREPPRGDDSAHDAGVRCALVLAVAAKPCR